MTAVATESPTLQEAFAAAKVEHSASAQNEPTATEASTGAGTVTQPDEATTAPPVTEAVAPDISDFLSDDELSTLKAKHGTDADALAKDLKAAYTKKTQSLAEQRKQVEALAEHADFIQALQSDPLTTLKGVAERMGWDIAPKSTGAQAADTATARTEAIASTVVDRVRAALGSELDFLAEPLARVISDALKTEVGQAIEPLKSAHKALEDKAALEQRDSVLKAFDAKHPDWKQHEAAMTKLMARIKPGDGVAPGEYLETLYELATKDQREGDAVKKAIAKMQAGAKADEGKGTTLAEGQVKPAALGRALTVQEAFAEAKREMGQTRT